MRKYSLVGPVLRKLSDGKLFTATFAGVVRVVAVLIGVGGVFSLIAAYKVVSNLEGMALLGGIVFLLVLIVAIAALIEVLLIRAAEIARIPLPNSQFVIIPIASVVIRMIGELFACMVTVLGVGGFLFLLLGGSIYELNRMIPDLVPWSWPLEGARGGAFASTTSFIEAFLLFVLTLFQAFITLVFFYLLAECTVVIVDIARNLRAVRDRLDAGGPVTPISNVNSTLGPVMPNAPLGLERT